MEGYDARRAYIGAEEWVNKIGADKKQLLISVDEALEINRKLGLKAFHGGYKVLILCPQKHES